MDDKSSGVFNGKVIVRQDAQKIAAYQSNKNILLSKGANVYSKPELEIYADDVRCSHGSTIGELRSEEHTSELQSRPHLVCRLLLEKKKQNITSRHIDDSLSFE